MTLLYRHRLLARYGSDTVELARFNRRIAEADIRFWTEGVECWEHERTLPDKECITARPCIQPYRNPRKALRLTHAEVDELRERGLQPEYKT